ncbi:MAG: metalloregulator ArsR/SmtB family transcription factor [Actinomycetota bacterium]
MKELNAADAEEYAGWFRCLSDGTRLLILNVVARAGTPMTVGEIVEQVDRSQSTVSNHLRILAEQRFVLIEPDGVRSLVRVNDACMQALPEAAAVIMATRAPLPR